MTPHRSRRQAYDPDGPSPLVAIDDAASLVVLLATPGSRGDEWAERASVALARQWAESGERIFLADLGVTRPSLHEVVGTRNGEGMSDVFLYGASLRRVARSVEGGFLFASAGTPVLEGGPVLESPRWRLLAQGFARADAHLVVFLPADEPGHHKLLEHAQRILLLTGPGEAGAASAVPGPANGRVSAVLSPAGGAAPELPPPAGPEPGQGTDDLTPVAPAAASDPAAPPTRDIPTVRPRRSTGAERAPGRTRWLVPLALVLLAALVAALVGLGILRVPGSRGTEAPAASEAGEAGDASRTPAGAVPVAGVAVYSVTLGSYLQAPVARLQAETLGERRPDILFVVAPVEVNGQVLHRLLAGMTEDPDALSLRHSLGQTLPEENPLEWLVRATPLAFHLGTFPELPDARRRVLELRERDVPAYALVRTDEPGEGLYDVWAGAYADSAEASYLRGMLPPGDRGARLTTRAGEPPE